MFLLLFLLFLTEKSRIKHSVIKYFYLIKNVEGRTKVDIAVKECLLTHKRKIHVVEATH